MNEIELKARFPRASKAFLKANVSQPVAGLPDTEPQHREVQTLASRTPKQAGSRRRSHRVHVLIVSFRSRKIDSDNLIGGAKSIRDFIAARLNLDDGDPRIQWEYDQILTRGPKGTHVLITLLAE